MKKIFSILLVLTMLLSALIIPVAADEAQVPEVLGASIRTQDEEGGQGLRFVGRIKKSGSITLTFGENANFGFLIIPESATTGAAITKDTQYVKQVKAEKLMSEADVEAVGLTYDASYYYFSVVQKGIPANFYSTSMVVKAYVNGGSYSYSNSGPYEKRSIRYVAEQLLEKYPESPYADLFNSIVATAAEQGTDIYVDADRFAVLETYPAYPSYIDRDTLYTVSVTQGLVTKPLTVYNECASYSQYDVSSTSRSLGVMDSNRRFCEFAFDYDAVTVNIKVNKNFSTYTVSPSSKFAAEDISYSNGIISVKVSKHDQFVVILDNDYKTALAVFPDGVEYGAPTKGATNVVYVEGNNQITLPESQPDLVTYVGSSNEIMVVKEHNVKIYLAPGAILKKRVIVARDDLAHQGYNAKIYGRGAILDPFSDYNTSNPAQSSDYTTVYDMGGNVNAKRATVNVYSYSFSMKDIKVLDSRNYNILICQSGAKIDNVKVLSTEMSTDGFMATQNATVKNSFAYCGDNALVLQGGDGGHYYENITIGTTCAAVYPQHSFNGSLKDIYVFRADDNLINVHENNSGAMTVNIDGLDALDCVKVPLIFGDNGSNGSETKTFNIKNLVTRNTTGSKKSFTAGTYASQYNSMECGSSGYIFNFTNLCVGGHRIGPSNDGSSIKVGSAYLGANTTGGTTQSGMTINFAYDSENAPAHTSVPAAKTANYTGGAAYVAGPIRPWSRYTSYSCTGYISGGQFTVTASNESKTHRWGYSIDLTEQMKSTGAGTYSYSVSTSGTTCVGILVKCANNSNSVTTTSGKSGSITVTASDLANYTYHFIVKPSSTNNTNGTITLTAWTFNKTK